MLPNIVRPFNISKTGSVGSAIPWGGANVCPPYADRPLLQVSGSRVQHTARIMGYSYLINTPPYTTLQCF